MLQIYCRLRLFIAPFCSFLLPEMFFFFQKLDGSKIRLKAEQVWRRVERKYEEKLQAWKEEEEKQIIDKMESLKQEYKQNLEFNQSQVCSFPQISIFSRVSMSITF